MINEVLFKAVETGKSTLEIALENNPADIIRILSNYGFHENSLRHAFNCLTNAKNEKNVKKEKKNILSEALKEILEKYD
jgi:hypothetical protein